MSHSALFILVRSTSFINATFFSFIFTCYGQKDSTMQGSSWRRLSLSSKPIGVARQRAGLVCSDVRNACLHLEEELRHSCVQ